jgi:hypothetical protein
MINKETTIKAIYNADPCPPIINIPAIPMPRVASPQSPIAAISNFVISFPLFAIFRLAGLGALDRLRLCAPGVLVSGFPGRSGNPGV